MGDLATDGEPELSVLLVTETVELCLETISHLRAQTAASKIELVLGVPGAEVGDEHASQIEGFHSVRVMDWDPGLGTAIGRAAGVFEATAPVVVLAETHCFPEPVWAEALIEAHRGPWTGVGPELDNDNPSPTSWGNMVVDYAKWIAPATPGPAADIPGHNSSYKRSVLLEYGDDLPKIMEAETILHWDLRARGHQLYIEPRARTNHRNIDRPRPALIEHFHNGRTFGAARSREWPFWRRALYALGSPLIPALRTMRALRHLRQKRRRDLVPQILPMMIGSFFFHAAGEMTGYMAGGGDSLPLMIKYELQRDRWLSNGKGRREEVRPTDPARK